MGKKILEILADGFEEVEALGALDFWRRAGIEVVLAGLSGRIATGAHGLSVTADCELVAVNADDFDAVVLPGGMPGAVNLGDSPLVLALVKRMAAAGKVTAAICAGPLTLARAGLLRSGRFTMYPNEGLRAKYFGELRPTDAWSECDGKVITGKGPGAVFAFAARVAGALGLEAEARRVAQDMLLPEVGL